MFLLSLLAGLVLSAGCGKPVNGLYGKVTLNGEKVPTGQVMAFNASNEVLLSTTIADGNYELTGLPPGTATLVVQTHLAGGHPLGISVLPPLPPGQPPLPPEVIQDRLKELPEHLRKAVEGLKPVPLKYADIKQSDLKANVTGGMTRFDIQMTGQGEYPPPLEMPNKPSGPVPPPPHPPGPR